MTQKTADFPGITSCTETFTPQTILQNNFTQKIRIRVRVRVRVKVGFGLEIEVIGRKSFEAKFFGLTFSPFAGDARIDSSPHVSYRLSRWLALWRRECTACTEMNSEAVSSRLQQLYVMLDDIEALSVTSNSSNSSSVNCISTWSKISANER